MPFATVESGLLPQILYKFRSLSDPHGMKLLEHQIAWFSSARGFNDPFDCSYEVRFDMMTREEMIQRAIESRTRFNQSRSRADAERVVDGLLANPSLFHQRVQALRDSILDTYGVFPLAGNRTSVLMWSHYADSHAGICIGLDSRALEDKLREVSREDGIGVMPHRVNYVRDYPSLVPTATYEDEADFYDQLLTTKSIDWQYEEEFRYIIISRANLAMYLPKRCFSEVVLGVRTTRETEDRVKVALLQYNNQVRLYRAHLKRRSFELEFEQIPY